MDKFTNKYAFLCQECGLVVWSNDWNKYHVKSNSCPICKSDMCGCPDCLEVIKKDIRDIILSKREMIL
jgi:hypothetical protein